MNYLCAPLNQTTLTNIVTTRILNAVDELQDTSHATSSFTLRFPTNCLYRMSQARLYQTSSSVSKEANLNLLILGSVAVVQPRVKAGMVLSLFNSVFGRDKLDDPSTFGTAARLTTLSSVPVTSTVIDDGLLTDFPASNSPDDALPRWLTGDCAAPRLARDIFALILAEATVSCDPDSRTGKWSSEVALACHLVKSS